MKRILPNIALHAIFIIFAFWILAIKNGFMLRWYDEMSLFEPGIESLRRFLLYPGGIFRFAATCLTQLLYYPALGASALILIWLLCVWILRAAFKFKGNAFPLCFLPPFCLLASVLQLDEACLSFESQGYVFYNTLGFLFTLGAYWLFAKMRGNILWQSTITLLLPLLYPLAGFFALLAALMCVIDIAVMTVRSRKAIQAVAALCALILSIVVPMTYYRHFTGTTVDNDFLYLKGLPELTFNDYDLYLWLPLAICAALLILYVAIADLTDRWEIGSSKPAGWCSVALFVAAIPLCLEADGRKSEQLRASVLMTQAIEDHNWQKAVHIMSLTKESPDYTMCVLDNLARTYCGLERRPVGNMTTQGTDYRHDEDFTITAFVNVPVNHHIGRFNQSHRWATEHNVQYGNKVYFIKYTVLNALMNGDLEFAGKFNRLLLRTMFHSRWAGEMQRYIDDPSLIPSLPDYDMLMYLRSEEMMRGE
ncbi:MAG: hypothetical protein K2L00_02465 [Muribaculaceae bacterium]|nr:hypothetical protein [Muribaculaceae bacterium]